MIIKIIPISSKEGEDKISKEDMNKLVNALESASWRIEFEKNFESWNIYGYLIKKEIKK